MTRKPIVTFYGTYLSQTRGSKISSESLAEELANRGYTVEMVSRSTLTAVRVAQWFWRVLTSRCDVIVLDVFSSRMRYMSNCIARIAARRDIPIIVILQGGALLERFGRIKHTLLPILKRAGRVVSPSRFLIDGFNALGYEVEEIPNALQLERFPYLERHHPDQIIRLLWVRAFAEIYRPNWPVEIVWHLRDKGISSRLTMIGPDKGLLGVAKAKAIELNVMDRIDFVGPVPNDELFRYFHSHDYFLNTTKYESFGVALAESAATGLPIVSAAVGEVNFSWKDNEDIFLVPGNSSLEFADRIAGLRETDQKGDQYRHVSRTAQEKVSGFAIGNILPRWEAIIESICDDRAG